MKISRRALLGSTGSLFVSGAFSQPILAAPRIHLRLLETSDLHMFVMDWDYFHAKNDPTVGLVKIADLVARARAEAPNSLLFDNGDIIQGNPLSDYVARERGMAQGAVHPMFAAMHRIGYDVATLGNHEFNYGLDFLRRSLTTSPFPFVCANLQALNGQMEVLGEQLESRKIIDRAKGRLIDQFGLKEQEAFSFIQRTAMKDRSRMRDVAEKILSGELQP